MYVPIRQQQLSTSSSAGTLLLASLLRGNTTTTYCDEAPASSSVVAPPPPPAPGKEESAPPPPPPASSSDDDAIAKAASSVSSYRNPGPYEQAAMDSKRLVTLDTFDGFRCDINKQVSPFMLAVHSFWLGTNMIPDGRKSTYSFLTQVADENGLLMARVDPTRGSVDGRIHRAILHGLAMAKVQVGVSQEGQTDQILAELDFGGLTWTGNLKYGSMGGGLVYGCNYFQAITPNLHMGGEGMYIAANQNLLGNYTIKYTLPAKTGEEDFPVPLSGAKGGAAATPPGMPAPETNGSSTICANYNSGQAACTINYKRVITPERVTLGAELQFSPFSLDSNLLMGAEFKLSRSKLSFCVDGGLRMQSIVEAKTGITPDAPTLQFSADVDHLKDEMRFGYGINING